MFWSWPYHSRKGDWSGNLAKSKDLSIVSDYYVGGMLDLAKNDCSLSLWLAKMVSKRQMLFKFRFPMCLEWIREHMLTEKT